MPTEDSILEPIQYSKLIPKNIVG